MKQVLTVSVEIGGHSKKGGGGLFPVQVPPPVVANCHLNVRRNALEFSEGRCVNRKEPSRSRGLVDQRCPTGL